MEKIKRALKLMEELELIQKEIIEELCEKIDTGDFNGGVVKISENPKIAIVKSSTLFGSRSWSPSFFIPECQKEAIQKELRLANGNIKQMHVKLKNIYEKKCAGPTYDKTLLNDKSLEVIREMLDGLELLNAG